MEDVRLQIKCISFKSAAFAVMLLAWACSVCQSAVLIANVCVQVDTMEMMRHPEETTNMRRQTVASYFRVGVFFVCFNGPTATKSLNFSSVWHKWSMCFLKTTSELSSELCLRQEKFSFLENNSKTILASIQIDGISWSMCFYWWEMSGWWTLNACWDDVLTLSC